MVNNYVKHGYLTKPDKKKYQRQQIARLIAITTLKSVFSIQEIAHTLNTLQSQASSDQLYDAFVNYMNQGIDPANPIIQTSCQTVKLYHQTLALIHHTKEEVIQWTLVLNSANNSVLERKLHNSVTHAVGAVIMLILLPISSTYSYETHGFLSSIGVSIFVISLFLMFLSSTIYHSMAYGSTHKIRFTNHRPFYDLCGYRRLLYASRIDFDE